MTPEDFLPAFTQGFVARDAGAVAALLAEDGQGLTLTGQWCDGRAASEAAWAAEFAGLLAEARLVTGKGRIQPLGPGAQVLHQRFILTGLRDETGAELPRLTVVLSAVILARPDGWKALTLHLFPVP